jgi:pimeloyl-ACP methyl ester carboxylesterase
VVVSGPAPGPRWLYLHGFASGPESAKGRALSAHFAASGVTLARLDLRLPSLEHLRLSAIVAHVRQRLGGERDRAVHVAQLDARVSALVLLAPAFRMAERWRQRIGEQAWEAWKRSGWLETKDHATGTMARVDFAFIEDVDQVDPVGSFPDVRVPTLIVHGVRDAVVDVELSRSFAQGRRHVRLVEVDDGHELVASIDRIKREADVFLRPWLNLGQTLDA